MLKFSLFLVVVFLMVGGSLQEVYEVDSVFGMEGHQALGVRQVTPTAPTFLELVSGSANFKINNPGSSSRPYFTLNDAPYYVLGALNCTNGQSPIYTSATSSWSCGQFSGYGASSGTAGGISCLAGNVLSYDGANWSCLGDQNTLQLTSTQGGCLGGDIPSYTTPSSSPLFVCDIDHDVLFAQCVAGDVMQYLSGSWGCFFIPDANTLGSLGCSAGQVAKWNGTAWICGSDIDTTAAIVCTEGQTLKYSASTSTYVCGTDADSVASLGCPVGSIVIKNSTTPSCYPMPLPNNPPIILIDGQTIASAAVPTTMSTFFGSYLERTPGLAPLQFLGGFSVVGASISLNKDPRTTGPRPDTGFSFALQLKDGATGNLLATIQLPANTTSYYTPLSLTFPLDTSKLSPAYYYTGLSNVVGVTVTSTLMLRVKNY